LVFCDVCGVEVVDMSGYTRAGAGWRDWDYHSLGWTLCVPRVDEKIDSE
jgi:hypothetical protein